jgi:hypothetical protein
MSDLGPTPGFRGLLFFSLLFTAALMGCSTDARAAAYPSEGDMASPRPSVASDVGAQEIVWPVGLRPLSELPELCRAIILDERTYIAAFGWRGCAVCNREVGFELGEVRALYMAVGEPHFLADRIRADR